MKKCNQIVLNSQLPELEATSYLRSICNEWIDRIDGRSGHKCTDYYHYTDRCYFELQFALPSFVLCVSPFFPFFPFSPFSPFFPFSPSPLFSLSFFIYPRNRFEVQCTRKCYKSTKTQRQIVPFSFEGWKKVRVKRIYKSTIVKTVHRRYCGYMKHANTKPAETTTASQLNRKIQKKAMKTFFIIKYSSNGNQSHFWGQNVPVRRVPWLLTMANDSTNGKEMFVMLSR